MYGYIKTGELEQLILKNRQALIITGINTVDIDEYINSCVITLYNYGLKQGLLNQPKIKYSKERGYIILLCFRHNVIFSEADIRAINNFILNMSNTYHLRDYFKIINDIHR